MKVASSKAKRIAAQIKNDDCWGVSITPDGRGCIIFTPDLRWRAEEEDSRTHLTPGPYYWAVYCDDDRRESAQSLGKALQKIKEFYATGGAK